MGGGPQIFGLPFGEGHLFFGPLPGRVTIFWAPGALKKTLIFHHLKEGYEQEIGLKMLEMAVLDSHFQNFLGEHAPRPP